MELITGIRGWLVNRGMNEDRVRGLTDEEVEQHVDHEFDTRITPRRNGRTTTAKPGTDEEITADDVAGLCGHGCTCPTY